MVNAVTARPDEVADAVMARGDAEAAVVTRLLLQRLQANPLLGLMEAWDLSATQAGDLFDVSRQAFTKWIKQGPPAGRIDDVSGIAAATAELERNLKPERISAVVRRPQSALDGLSLLQYAQTHSGRETAQAARAMFDIRQVQP